MSENSTGKEFPMELVWIIIFSMIGLLLYELGLSRQKFSYAFGTDPPGAEIIVDQVLAGKSPIKYELLLGTHVVEIRKAGYRPISRAFEVRLPSKDQPTRESYALNIELQLEAIDAKVIGEDASAASPQKDAIPEGQQISEYQASLEDVKSEIGAIKNLIFASPEDSYTAGFLKIKINDLEERIKIIQGEFWILAGLLVALIAIIIGSVLIRK